MKKLDYLNFERNRYYYGKFLSVGDFESEQEYMNNKRRLINRFFYGMGLLCGMEVVAVDEKTISIDEGVALDFSGREIVVNAPVIKKLSTIDGFDSESDEDTMYLCIEYDETQSEPLHSITNADTSLSDGIQYNKFSEGFRLFLTSDEPDTEIENCERYYIKSAAVYKGNGISIVHKMPIMAAAGGKLRFDIIIDKLSQPQNISFEYEIKLTGLKYNGRDSFKVIFDENTFTKSDTYKLTYMLDVMAINDDDYVYASCSANPLKLSIGNANSFDERIAYSNKSKVTDKNIKRELIKDYHENFMETAIKYNSCQQSIYLAKIKVIRAGSTYVIDKIVPVPFNQYIFNSQITNIMLDMLIDDAQNGISLSSGNTDNPVRIYENKTAVSPASDEKYTVAGGMEVISLGIGGKQGQKFFSQPVVHGLGLGDVSVTVGIAEDISDNSAVIYGSQDIFDSKSLKAETAVKLDPEKGTFIIGLKLLETTVVSEVKVYWTAVCRKHPESELHERRMFIVPNIVDLNVMQEYYFSVECENMADKSVNWSVKEINGGVINSNGMYTAPNVPGVYEIIAESKTYPEVRASVYVIVRDVK